MHRQTVEQAMSLLSIVQQPAFCIRKNGTLAYNEAAKHLVPSCAAALPQWLGTSSTMYELWDRSSDLLLNVRLHNADYAVTLQPLTDGTLFLMNACTISTASENALAVSSQVLRQPLSDMSTLLHQMERGAEIDTASLSCQLHRLTRIVSNLTEIGRLSAGEPRLNMALVSTQDYPVSLLDEIKDLCRAAGRDFSYVLPKKSLNFYADTALLNRALLNLVSNALKFSAPGTPILVRSEVIGTHLVFQVENDCSNNSSELLRAAFNRLSHRGILPDPKWGVGLGLPLANVIARLHGGMVAVETLDGKATVTLSVSLHDRSSALGSPLQVDYTGGMRQALLELSDVLPQESFRK